MKIDFDALTSREGVQCSCGKTHNAFMPLLKLGSGILGELPSQIKALGYKKPMLISGPYSFEAVGRDVCTVLKEAGLDFSLFVFPENGGKKLQPNEHAIALAVENFDRSCDLLLTVGSGSVNDVCKAVAFELDVPQITVGSAPSMDGYTSASSSLEINSTKASITYKSPVGVVCDVDYMAQAPMRMLWAGLGDIAAKTCSIREWEMASIIRGEFFCPQTAQMVVQSYERSFSGAAGIPTRDKDSVYAVIEGLLLSGVCMALVDSSRPASGLEHYFSHSWEMMAIARGKEYDLHGIYVGIGTLITLRLFKKLRELKPTREQAEKAAAAFDRASWEARLRRVFPGTAENMIALEDKLQKNEYTGRMKRVDSIIANWDRIVAVLEKAPDPDELEKILKSSGMPTKARDIGLSEDDVADAFVCSRDTRDKYLTSSVIWDIGYMEEFENWIREDYKA